MRKTIAWILGIIVTQASQLLSCPPLDQIARPDLVKFRGRDEDFTLPSYATPEWKAKNQDEIVRIFVLDTETTGLDKSKNVVIEFGGRMIEVNRETGELIGLGESYGAFQDPGEPLSEEIVNLTHITNEQVRGQSIDWNNVERIMSSADIVLAHNAEFDRGFIELKVPGARDKVWACSYKQINWVGKGHKNSKLPELSKAHGFYVDAHRAVEDVNATVYLLSKKGDKGHYLGEIVKAANTATVRVEAIGAPYAVKDQLAKRGYAWNGKFWSRYLPAEERAREEEWLAKEIYTKGDSQARIIAIGPKDLFR